MQGRGTIARTRALNLGALGDSARGSALPMHVPEGGVAWTSGERALVGWGRARIVRAGGGDRRFERAAGAIERALGDVRVEDDVGGWGTGPLAFGAFSFDPDSSASVVVVPAVVVGRDGDRLWVTTVGDGGERAWAGARATRSERAAVPAVRATEARPGDAEWLEAGRAARSAVRDGIVDKIVLARSVEVVGDERFAAAGLVDRLAARFPQCFTFAVDGLVGASPELLVRRSGRRVESVVLGGSAPRGATPAADRVVADRLRHSRKDRIEHELAVATVRDGLAAVCNGVTIDEQPSVMRLPHVQHLRTTARAELGRELGVVALAGALHPTAAICGSPADKALAAIRELESFDRWRYGGPVGWTDRQGNGEFAIALRCARLRGARATLYAGAGIVADSDPEDELAETELKLRALLDALEVRGPTARRSARALTSEAKPSVP